MPLETAQTAFLELDIVIKQTGGGAETQNACTPLALARQKIEADEELGDEAQEHVIGLLEEVSDERGVGLEDADPLTDAIFRARSTLKERCRASRHPVWSPTTEGQTE